VKKRHHINGKFSAMIYLEMLTSGLKIPIHHCFPSVGFGIFYGLVTHLADEIRQGRRNITGGVHPRCGTDIILQFGNNNQRFLITHGLPPFSVKSSPGWEYTRINSRWDLK